MSKFKVNEIAIIAPCPGHEIMSGLEKYVGEEVEVISELISNDPEFLRPHYNVLHKDNIKFGVAEHILIKKKPPEEDINWVEKLNLKMPDKVKV